MCLLHLLDNITTQVIEGQKTWLADAGDVAHFNSLNMEANDNVCHYCLFVIGLNTRFLYIMLPLPPLHQALYFTLKIYLVIEINIHCYSWVVFQILMS